MQKGIIMEKWGRLVFSLACFFLAGIICCSKYNNQVVNKAETEKEAYLQEAAQAIEEAEKNMGNSFEECKSSIVQFSMNQAKGSGVIYRLKAPAFLKDGIVVVTCAHVLEHWDEYSTVRLYDTYEVRGEIIGTAQSNDVGFLWISYEELGRQAEGLETVTMAETSAQGFEKDDFMFLTGFSEEGLIYRTGVLREKNVYMESFGEEMLLCTARAEEGMSGGGVFRENGIFEGLVCAASEGDLTACIPCDTVEAAFIDICEKKGQNNVVE